MSERLSTLSESVRLELTTLVDESRANVRASLTIVEKLSGEPVVVNGTRSVLEDIAKKLDETDELHLAVLKQIGQTYGHPPADNGSLPIDSGSLVVHDVKPELTDPGE